MSKDKQTRKDAGAHKLVDIIKLFPDVPDRSRHVRAFIGLCYRYALWYDLDESPNDGKPLDSATRRSSIHNEIMDIIQRLFLQPDAVVRYGDVMPDRVQVRKLILAHRARYQRKK